MIEDIHVDPPGVRKIKKSYVIGAIVVIVGLFAFFSLGSIKSKNLQESPSAQEKPVATTDAIQIESFLRLPASYAEAMRAEEDQRETKRAEKTAAAPPPRPSPAVPQPLASPAAGPSGPQQVKSLKEQERERALRSKIFFQKGTQRASFTPAATAAEIPDGTPPAGAGFVSASQAEGSEMHISQKNKQEFLEEHGGGAIYLDQRLQEPVSPYQIMAGTVLPGVLISGINSDLPGQIIAQIKANVFDTVSGQYLLIPQGARLLGSYDNMITWGQDRVLLVWNRLIFPNGSSIVLNSMPGADLSGYAGLKDKVNYHYLKLATAVLLSTFLNVGARVTAGDVSQERYYPTVEQQIASEAAAGVNQAGQKIVDRMLNIPPTIEIRPGFPFNVMVNKDIILRPYHG